MRKSWCILLLLLASGAAHAASFDCSKAKRSQEKVICGSPDLSAADEQVAAVYKALLAATTTEIKSAARDNQRIWNLKMAADCKSSEAEPGAALATCLLASYKARILELNRILTDGDYKFVSKSIKLTTPNTPDGGQASPDTEETPGSGTLKATWPQSTKDSPEWIAWNKAMEAAVQKMASSDAKGDSPGEWSKKWAEDTETDITVSVNYVGARVDRGFHWQRVDGARCRASRWSHFTVQLDDQRKAGTAAGRHLSSRLGLGQDDPGTLRQGASATTRQRARGWLAKGVAQNHP